MKTFTFLAIFIFAFSLNAQISLNSDDIIGSGKVIELATDYTPDASVTPGLAGANQTWDFSGLSVDDLEKLLTMNPDWTPYSFFFPNANLVMYSPEDSVYMYLQNSTTALSMLGMYGTFLDSIEMPVIYTPPLILAEFPVQYQNHKDSDASFSFFMPISGVPGVDSAKFKMDVMTTTDIDAWGTITIPLGSFEALRFYTVEESTDSIWFKMGGFWTFYMEEKDISNTYSWWSNDNATGYILVEFDYFAANDSVGEVTFLNSSPAQSIANRQTSSLISIYPNPSDNYINFDYEGESDAQLELFNNVGKLLLSKEITAREITKISMEKYPSGIYFYNLVGNNGDVISTGKFCKK